MNRNHFPFSKNPPSNSPPSSAPQKTQLRVPHKSNNPSFAPTKLKKYNQKTTAPIPTPS